MTFFKKLLFLIPKLWIKNSIIFRRVFPVHQASDNLSASHCCTGAHPSHTELLRWTPTLNSLMYSQGNSVVVFYQKTLRLLTHPLLPLNYKWFRNKICHSFYCRKLLNVPKLTTKLIICFLKQKEKLI